MSPPAVNHEKSKFRQFKSKIVTINNPEGLMSKLIDGKFDGLGLSVLGSAEAVKEATLNAIKDSQLIDGRFYLGNVVDVNLATKTVTLSIKGTVLRGCVYVAGAMASYFGLENTSLPALGTTVLAFYTNKNSPVLIVGTIGGQAPVDKALPDSISGRFTEKDFNAKQQESIKPDLSKSKGEGVAQGPPVPLDLVPGEMNQTLSTGTMVRLLYNFAQIGASDAAKIEACILNDMVRIVDNYFVHHTCGGDELIWSAGRCTKENHFTGYPFEAEGKKSKEEELCPEKSEGIYDLTKDLESISGDTGRWRLSEYIGFLGDMIHKWVTTPTEVASNIMEKALRAGQFRSWIGSDGTYCVQAAGGIQMEVTQYIVIPEILKAWNDPEFDMEKAMEDLDAEFLKVWGKGPDWEDLKVACWQMHYYTKYITLWHSLARFRQLASKGYCKIPKESEIPERKPPAEEEDKKTANPDADCKQKGHALFSMDPSGNMVFKSNATTAITMFEGNIQIACPGNLELKAGGIVTMQGHSVSIRGAQRVEITSLFGTLVTTARTAWKALCELGTVWIKGDGREDSEISQSEVEERIASLTQEEREFKEFAVVLDAAQGKTLVNGRDGVVVATRAKEGKGHITLQASGKESNINLNSTADIHFNAQERIYSKAKSILFKATEGLYVLSCKAVNFLNQVVIQKGAAHINMLKGNIISAYQSFLGRQEHVGKLEQETLDKYYKPELATPELDKANEEEEQEDAEDKKADKAISKQMELIFKTSFEWDKFYKPFSKDEMQYSLYESPLDVAGKLDEEEEYVKIKISEFNSLHKEKAPRTEYSVYPQKYGKYTSAVTKGDKDVFLCEEAWEKDFTSGDIKGIKDMRSEEYVYTFRKP